MFKKSTVLMLVCLIGVPVIATAQDIDLIELATKARWRNLERDLRFGLDGREAGSAFTKVDLKNSNAEDIAYFDDVQLRKLSLVQNGNFELYDETGLSPYAWQGGLTETTALKQARKYGYTYGIAVNCGLKMGYETDEALKAYLDSITPSPFAWHAMQAEGREWLELFSRESRERFDYVFTDAMTWTNDNGKRMRLWIPREVEIGDKQEFMDMLVDRAVGILTTEPIDIYVNPTYLPTEIAGEYDALWTDERMDRVIAAAVRNGVAIEINSRFRLPSERFIRKAKAAGAKFSFGTNNGGADDLGQLAYSRLMARRCGLTKNDMFVPRPEGGKAVQRKRLPRRYR